MKCSKRIPRSVRLTEEEKDEVFDKTDGACYWCGEQLLRGRYGKLEKNAWEPDHIVPQSKGGEDDVSNLVPSCPGCNRSRQDTDAEDFDKEWENDSVVGEVYKLTPVGHRGAGLYKQHRQEK
jgi:5-methylcytosine-specific restriction endonuclease McrA